MSPISAITFMFRRDNLPKILTIAIGYSLINFLMGYFMGHDNAVFAIIAAFALLIFTLAISGYYISILSRLLESDERIPTLEASDIKRGVGVGCATLLYVGVFVLAVLVVSFVFQDFLLVLLLALGLPLWITLPFALQVGYVRYAQDGNTSGLYAIKQNLGIVWSNKGRTFELLANQVLLSIIAGVIGFVLGGGLGLLFPRLTLLTQYEISSIAHMLTFTDWLLLAGYDIITYSLGVVMGAAQMYILANYAYQIGLVASVEEKPKQKMYQLRDLSEKPMGYQKQPS